MALLNAYNGWTEAMSQSRGKEFVDQRFLHWGTLNMIRGKWCLFSSVIFYLLPRQGRTLY